MKNQGSVGLIGFGAKYTCFINVCFFLVADCNSFLTLSLDDAFVVVDIFVVVVCSIILFDMSSN